MHEGAPLDKEDEGDLTIEEVKNENKIKVEKRYSSCRC